MGRKITVKVSIDIVANMPNWELEDLAKKAIEPSDYAIDASKAIIAELLSSNKDELDADAFDYEVVSNTEFDEKEDEDIGLSDEELDAALHRLRNNIIEKNKFN